jgi:hypothetical protein
LQKIAPRIMVPAVIAAWEYAKSCGEASVVTLMQLVSDMCREMDQKVLCMYVYHIYIYIYIYVCIYMAGNVSVVGKRVW